jgi:histidine ammonia-lyase
MHTDEHRCTEIIGYIPVDPCSSVFIRGPFSSPPTRELDAPAQLPISFSASGARRGRRCSGMVLIDGNTLTIEDVRAVAGGERVGLAAGVLERVRASRAVIEAILTSDRVVYGVNTGFGKLSDVRIRPEDLRALQLNLVRSHSCGVGPPLPEPATRAMMLLRANVLAKGHSGVRPVVLETLVEMLNRGVVPVIPSKGSVGASGDLAPLAHLALGAVGEGEASFGGARMAAGEGLTRAGLEPLVLEAKEGIALLNGTQAMAAVGGLALLEVEALARAADVTGAMTLEALSGTPVAFDPRIHAARAHEGQREVAAHMLELLSGSEIRESHRDCTRVQDAYCLRCIPQVHGAVRDAAAHVRRVLAVELNSATDNPLVFPDTGEVLSGGNFHGEPLALAFDYLTMAAGELASIAERRVERLVNPDLSGLPPFLIADAGTNSGFMIAQVVAVSLVAENKVLAHPASVDNLPTSANKEDHVSMGMTSALKLAQVVENVRSVLAIEALCAAQALDFRAPLKPGRGVARAHERVRAVVPHLERDAVVADLIAAVTPLVAGLDNGERV